MEDKTEIMINEKFSFKVNDNELHEFGSESLFWNQYLDEIKNGCVDLNNNQKKMISDYIFRAIDSEYKKNVSNKDSITCKVYIDNEEYSIPQSVILYSMNQW
jgi:hypothetical protein